MYDDCEVMLIDCPPSLGVLTINGLTAAFEVLIPLQCEALSHRGVGQLLETIDDVRMFANGDLEVRGVIPTMYDERTRHSRAVIDDVRQRYGLPVLDPPVRKSIRFAEAPQRGMCIIQHAPTSPGAEAYRALARVLDADPGPDALSGLWARAAGRREDSPSPTHRPPWASGPCSGLPPSAKRTDPGIPTSSTCPGSVPSSRRPTRPGHLRR